jgi:hypothetical protein
MSISRGLKRRKQRGLLSESQQGESHFQNHKKIAGFPQNRLKQKTIKKTLTVTCPFGVSGGSQVITIVLDDNGLT